MAKLNSFTFISLNGFYKGMEDDIKWHKHGSEEAEYSVANLKTNNTLLFGRITYEMMAVFWSTQMAHDTFPEVAEGMNRAKKIVVSKNLKSADWKNTSIISGNLVKEVTKLKQTSSNNITLLGSGTILTQLTEANLVNVYQFMIDPVFLNGGTPIMASLQHNLDLRLTKSQVFKSGTILLSYEPYFDKKSSKV